MQCQILIPSRNALKNDLENSKVVTPIKNMYPQKIKDFFFAKIGNFWKSIAGPLASFIQAYTQPYSFGGSKKLIVCQIRYELSVITIHEISTSWKKER